MKTFVAILACSISWPLLAAETGGGIPLPAPEAQAPGLPLSAPYQFDGTLSRQTLERFLSRAISVSNLSCSPFFEDDCRMLNNVGAKYLGRVAYLWGQPPESAGGPAAGDEYWRHVRKVADRLLRDDPDRILQACVFEAVYDGVDKVPVPAWAFEAFGLPVEPRNFSYKAMLFDNGRFHNLWGPGASVPDITKLETKLWFYVRARRYIDAGYESIHLGQFGLIGAQDPKLLHWKEVLDKLRAYAAQHARRHLVLFDAHVVVKNQTPAVDGRFLLDFLAFPLRPKEVANQPQKAVLEVGHADTIYQRSPGGVHPCGWKCEHLPYLVEFDQCSASGREGQPGLGIPFVWGYEEAAWLASQKEEDRNAWLEYADRWLRQNDPNGHLQMPGSIPAAIPINGDPWYRANLRSPACPMGYNQEETIRKIWRGQ